MTATRGAPTIRDVARAAGVSVATVSRVLRGSAPVAGGTRDRVEQAVRQLEFRPSRLGRSLAERRHTANGIVFPDLAGPYYAEVVLGYEEVAAELGRSVLILSTHGRPAAPDMVLDLADRVDGMVVLGRTVDDGVVQMMAAGGLPLVLLARPPLEGVDAVSADSAHSAAVLGEHLLSHGHTDVVLLGDPEASPDVATRFAGLRAAYAGASTPRIQQAGFSTDDGERAAASLIDRLPHAVVCANDELALGLIVALRRAGVSVPGDVAVTGWDDVMAARYAGLTTVRQPMRELGAHAARALDARVHGDDSPPRRDVLPTRLIVRESCGTHTRTTEDEEVPS